MDYQVRDGIPGRYFRCETHRMVLSEAACSANYRRAGENAKTERAVRLCLGCPIGAGHAVVLASPTPPDKSMVCCRCHGLSTRLIRGEICVSCYNREREVKKGRNGRGTAPKPAERFFLLEPPPARTKVVVVHRVRVGVVGDRGRQAVQITASTPVEARLRAGRNRAIQAFCWVKSRPVARVTLF